MKIRLKTPTLHYSRANVIACPKCKAEADKLCIRRDGKGSRTHRARVLAWERIKSYGISIKLANKIDSEYERLIK